MKLSKLRHLFRFGPLLPPSDSASVEGMKEVAEVWDLICLDGFPFRFTTIAPCTAGRVRCRHCKRELEIDSAGFLKDPVQRHQLQKVPTPG